VVQFCPKDSSLVMTYTGTEAHLVLTWTRASSLVFLKRKQIWMYHKKKQINKMSSKLKSKNLF